MSNVLLGIDRDALEAWWRSHIPTSTLPLSLERLAGGRSNLTYKVGDQAGRSWALRRPPLGERLSSAHDMAREFKIVDALGGSAVPVPAATELCEDVSVIGAPFYLADFVPGRVLRQVGDGDLAPRHEERRRIGEDLVAKLVDLHSIEPATVGLGDLGRSDGYLERQLTRWQRQWEATKTRDVILMDEVRSQLRRTQPKQTRTSLVHGDYRLDNAILDESGSIAAILDWELCAQGDPLADLGLLLVYWAPPGENLIPGFEPATRLPGFPSRREVSEIYASRSGVDVGDIAYYVAFSLWRVAVIVEGVRARNLEGKYGEAETWDDGEAGASVVHLAEAAAALLRPGADPFGSFAAHASLTARHERSPNHG